jgi:hypothetical protein
MSSFFENKPTENGTARVRHFAALAVALTGPPARSLARGSSKKLF